MTKLHGGEHILIGSKIDRIESSLGRQTIHCCLLLKFNGSQEELLCPLYTVTKTLQAEELTAGEFLFEGKQLIFDMTKKGSSISEEYFNSMNRREPQLTDNYILLAAVFVEPKHRILLDEAQ